MKDLVSLLHKSVMNGGKIVHQLTTQQLNMSRLVFLTKGWEENSIFTINNW